MTKASDVLRNTLRTIRTIMGMPDYDRYVEHCAHQHPGEAVMSRRDYYAYFVNRRYGNGPTRCC